MLRLLEGGRQGQIRDKLDGVLGKSREAGIRRAFMKMWQTQCNHGKVYFLLLIQLVTKRRENRE